MARGISKVTFIGGNMDGVISEIMYPPKKLFLATGFYFSQEQPEGEVLIIKGDFTKDKNWISYGVDVYLKKSKKPRELGTTYEFLESTVRDRCTAITKKGTRCLHEALVNKTYCSSIHKGK